MSRSNRICAGSLVFSCRVSASSPDTVPSPAASSAVRSRENFASWQSAVS
jgi:hypothetical protein